MCNMPAPASWVRRMGLSVRHPRLIARLTQGFAPPLSGVPDLEPLCPTVHTDDAGLDHACRLLQDDSVNEHQRTARQDIGMGAQEGGRNLLGCLVSRKEQRFQHGQRCGGKGYRIAAWE